MYILSHFGYCENNKKYAVLWRRPLGNCVKREVISTICNKAVSVHKTQRRGTVNRCSSGKAIDITYSKSVFVALGTQREIRLRHIVICGLPGSTIFFHTIINGTIFGNKLSNIKPLFGFL